MSHSQFHSTKLLILRHAWLNLWDKHMTTGRINQVTITLGSPHAHTHTLRVCHSYVYIYMRASFPSLRKEPHNRMHASLFPTFVFVSSSWKHFVFVSEMRPRIVPNSRGAPVGQASFWAVLLLSFSAGLCVALAQVSAQSRFASSPLLDGKSTAATWLHWPIWRLHTTSLMLWELPIWGINLN